MRVLHGRVAWVLALAGVAALSGCDAGSRSVTPEYYAVHYRLTQTATGAVVVTGETDLPDGSEIDALVSRTSSVDRAVDTAVLTGGTEEQPISKPVKNGSFTINTRVLGNSCGLQPPCGPFPAGRYLLLLDARTPNGPIGSGVSTFDDPRYLSTTHGVAGFTGIEISDQVTLKPIQLCIDAVGSPKEGGGCVAA